MISRLRKGRSKSPTEALEAPEAPTPTQVEGPQVDIAPDDPIIALFQSVPGAVDIDTIELDSPAVSDLKAAGVRMVVPLVSQGELIGLLNLGPRLSEREYSIDDRKLLDNLAAHAAPAVRVAQLVRQQEAEVRTRERLEQELRVAQLIQQQFLPKELPELQGWQVAAYYKPARAVGGDFYDFLELPDGKVGIVVGDVTDKGVPAALVMATTHSIIRGDAPRLVSPSKVLERANDLLYPDIPAHMFVTCLYAVLDPKTGEFQYANAGHNLPYVRNEDGSTHELRATGMPLGLMPGMSYEEKDAILQPGSSMLLHSDGVAEAHNPDREMFGFPRLMGLVGQAGGDKLIDRVLEDLDSFTGAEWEQEDDITLVTIGRSGSGRTSSEIRTDTVAKNDQKTLVEFEVPSEQGNERIAMQKVAESVSELRLDEPSLEKLKTAVAEATMNAMEHGNKNQPDVPVAIKVVLDSSDLSVHITDQGGDQGPVPDPETPDLLAKLAGEQSPRGWGLFLIKNMVDEMNITSDEQHHTIELVFRLKGTANGS